MKNTTPAVLVYASDFISDTVHLSNEQMGQYWKLLLHQNIKGHMSMDYITAIIGETPHPFVMDFFTEDEDGLFYNERMEEEILRRCNFQESRNTNGKKGGRPKKQVEEETAEFQQETEFKVEEEKPTENLNKTYAKPTDNLPKTYRKPTQNLKETYAKPTQNHIETETEIITSNFNKQELNNNNLYRHEQEKIAKQVVEHLNEVTGGRRKLSKETQKHINARLKEGHTLDEFIAVIDNKADQWLNDPKMSQYLRPRTLFGTKFDDYLNEPKRRSSGNAFLDLLTEMRT